MGMIKRSVGFIAPVNVTTSLYRILVRSNLEYISSVTVVSHSSTYTYIKAIEAVQRAATDYIFLIIREINSSNDAPFASIIHYVTDVKLQIC